MFGVTIPISVAVQSAIGALEERIFAALARAKAPGGPSEGSLERLATWPSAEDCARINSRSFELTPLQHELPPLPVTYAEYMHVCNSLRQTEAFHAASAYWDNRIAELPPGPTLPMAREAVAPVWRSRSIRIAADTLE